MEVPRFLLGDNTDHSDAIFVIHTKNIWLVTELHLKISMILKNGLKKDCNYTSTTNSSYAKNTFLGKFS